MDLCLFSVCVCACMCACVDLCMSLSYDSLSGLSAGREGMNSSDFCVAPRKHTCMLNIY